MKGVQWFSSLNLFVPLSLCFTWPLMMCINRDINSGHSSRKWKWSKMIFGFLERKGKNERKMQDHQKTTMKINYFRTDNLSVISWEMLAKGHIDSPGYKTLQHLIMLANKLYKTRWSHSGRGNRTRMTLCLHIKSVWNNFYMVAVTSRSMKRFE